MKMKLMFRYMWADMFHFSYITITLNASHISSNVGHKIAFTDRAYKW